MVVLWLGCRCCRLSVNTICGHIIIGLSLLSSISKHYMVVLWLGCRCCRPSVNTICGRIMMGLSLSSVSKHNMLSYCSFVMVQPWNIGICWIDLVFVTELSVGVHDTFLESPSSGTIIIKRMESQITKKPLQVSKSLLLSRLFNVRFMHAITLIFILWCVCGSIVYGSHSSIFLYVEWLFRS